MRTFRTYATARTYPLSAPHGALKPEEPQVSRPLVQNRADHVLSQVRDPARSRQMHILTTRRDMSAAEIRYRMGSRWRQENHYRYARIHFDLDSHDTYRASDDDGDRMVPNPAKKPAHRDVENARRALKTAEEIERGPGWPRRGRAGRHWF